jgi:hypothetical protein
MSFGAGIRVENGGFQPRAEAASLRLICQGGCKMRWVAEFGSFLSLAAVVIYGFASGFIPMASAIISFLPEDKRQGAIIMMMFAIYFLLGEKLYHWGVFRWGISYN